MMLTQNVSEKEADKNIDHSMQRVLTAVRRQ